MTSPRDLSRQATEREVCQNLLDENRLDRKHRGVVPGDGGQLANGIRIDNLSSNAAVPMDEVAIATQCNGIVQVDSKPRIKRQPQITRRQPTGNAAVLFTVINGSNIEFWVGGDRNPVLVYTVPDTHIRNLLMNGEVVRVGLQFNFSGSHSHTTTSFSDTSSASEIGSINLSGIGNITYSWSASVSFSESDPSTPGAGFINQIGSPVPPDDIRALATHGGSDSQNGVDVFTSFNNNCRKDRIFVAVQNGTGSPIGEVGTASGGTFSLTVTNVNVGTQTNVFEGFISKVGDTVYGHIRSEIGIKDCDNPLNPDIGFRLRTFSITGGLSFTDYEYNESVTQNPSDWRTSLYGFVVASGAATSGDACIDEYRGNDEANILGNSVVTIDLDQSVSGGTLRNALKTDGQVVTATANTASITSNGSCTTGAATAKNVRIQSLGSNVSQILCIAGI